MVKYSWKDRSFRANHPVIMQDLAQFVECFICTAVGDFGIFVNVYLYINVEIIIKRSRVLEALGSTEVGG